MLQDALVPRMSGRVANLAITNGSTGLRAEVEDESSIGLHGGGADGCGLRRGWVARFVPRKALVRWMPIAGSKCRDRCHRDGDR